MKKDSVHLPCDEGGFLKTIKHPSMSQAPKSSQQSKFNGRSFDLSKLLIRTVFVQSLKEVTMFFIFCHRQKAKKGLIWKSKSLPENFIPLWTVNFWLLDVQCPPQTMPCGHRNSHSRRWVKECLDLCFLCDSSASALRFKAALALDSVNNSRKRKRTLILAGLSSLSRSRYASN